MDVASIIASFSTGSYTVTRTPNDTIVRGRAVPAATSTLTIVASVAPATGDTVMRLPEGMRTNETRTLITATRLYAGGRGRTYEADEVTIEGEQWRVEHVENWLDSSTGDIGYRCLIQAVRT